MDTWWLVSLGSPAANNGGRPVIGDRWCNCLGPTRLQRVDHGREEREREDEEEKKKAANKAPIPYPQQRHTGMAGTPGCIGRSRRTDDHIFQEATAKNPLFHVIFKN